jgi:UDP-GlcNAc:undecaprenyl-phosphate GlcNAc-1-phosphate transferase
VLVFYVWTGLISVTCLLFFFVAGWLVWILATLGLIAASVFTVWPVLKRRREFQPIEAQESKSNV